ncbi:MAG: ABC transporter permease subunit [Elusimicrobia bacterium]|nr:ABC transporter permease subunit [Elusimicrobiota bacterium]
MRRPWWYKTKNLIKGVVSHGLCLAVAITCIFPLVWMISSSLKTQRTVFTDMSIIPSSPEWFNYVIAWTKGNFGIYFFNSLFYTVTVVFGIIAISSLAAYAFSRLEFPGKNILFVVLISTMMIPVPGALIALYVLLLKLGLVNTRLGYILPQINGGLALGIFLLKTFFDKLPKDLEDAARIDGCNKFQVYMYVALPLAKPAIAVLVIFNALTVWNEFVLALLILNDQKLMPLQRGLMVFQGQHITEYPVLMAGITITVLPIILLYFIMQRHIISGIAAGALKS